MGRFSKLEVLAPVAETAPPAAKPKPEEELGLAIRTDEDIPLDLPGVMRRGDEAFFSGEPKEALRWYSRAMQDDSTCLDSWIAQIRIQILEGDLGDAKVWINRALSIFPDAPALLALRAVNNARSGLIRDAVAASDLILSRRSDDPHPWICRGQILAIAGNKNSDFCFTQAFKMAQADDWKTPFLIGIICDSERLWAKSVAYYQAAIGRRGSLPYAWYRIALAHRELGNTGPARKALVNAEAACGDNERLRLKIVNTSPRKPSFLRGLLQDLFGWMLPGQSEHAR